MTISDKVTPAFFIDTADIEVVERVWDKLHKHVGPSSLLGITTNPSALAKINCDTLDKLETTVYKLSRFMTQTVGGGSVHVQLPNSRCSSQEISRWAFYVSGLGDGRTAMGLKLPPFKSTLDFADGSKWGEHKLMLNVTGIADAATIVRVLHYPTIRYASLIPGRMEEVGIDAQQHLQYLQMCPAVNLPVGSGFRRPLTQKVITGSMRTIDGLKRAIDAGTVPTIGNRVWDLMTDDDYANFASWWKAIPAENGAEQYYKTIPSTDQKNVNLTQGFFDQMDELGKPLFHELKTKL
jgi:hypothetical protein